MSCRALTPSASCLPPPPEPFAKVTSCFRYGLQASRLAGNGRVSREIDNSVHGAAGSF